MVTTANLLAEYGLNPSPLTIPAMEAVLTIWPPSPWARMCGRKRSDAVQHAHQIDVEHPAPIIERNVVDAAAAGDAGIVADDMDVAERLECEAAAARSTLSGSVTSQVTPRTSGPKLCRLLTAAANASVSISASITCMPASANARPSASPMPLAPPVTKRSCRQALA